MSPARPPISAQWWQIGQLEQVLMNMVVNARDAMPEGGQVVIETANAALDAANAEAPNGAACEYVMLSVSDTGTGMTDEVKAHLFEPFFTTKEKGQGTGLGLATSYVIVERLGGRIAFNLEFKRPRTAAYTGLEDRVLFEVKRRGLLGETLFSCFYDDVLATLRGLESAARIGLLISRRSAAKIDERAAALRAEAIHPALPLASADLVERAHARGFRVNVYTVDDPDDQRRLIARGVDGIFTNVPAQLHGILAESSES